MHSKEGVDHDLPWFTMKSSTAEITTGNLITDNFDAPTMTATELDYSDSPSVSPLNFCVEPVYQPIPLRFSKLIHQKSYEFCPIPSSELPRTISYDNAERYFQDIQSMSSKCAPAPKPIEMSSQATPLFVNSNFSKNDWQKFNCRSMRQSSSDDFRQYDSERYYQGNTLNDAVGKSIRNQYLLTAGSFDATKSSSSLESSDVVDEKKTLKALSAYNFFFRHERERILAGDKSVESEDVHYSYSEKQSLLHNHWYRDRSQKRCHRKSHGKISFAALSRIVAQRWKELPKHLKKFYQDLAAEDLKRYRHEVLQNESGANLHHASKLKFFHADQMKDIVFDASTFFDFHPVN